MERERKVEEFAKEIIRMASKEELTVSELREATYIAKRIANNSIISDKERG